MNLPTISAVKSMSSELISTPATSSTAISRRRHRFEWIQNAKTMKNVSRNNRTGISEYSPSPVKNTRSRFPLPTLVFASTVKVSCTINEHPAKASRNPLTRAAGSGRA
ncbi:hypothetical protein NWF34_22550 [Gordonia sp. GONU]|uniref:hypothetical protein n=1 Tax=Gordonia sp. GONU TaxID=2972949 RepID=UPI0021AC1AA4|nr:hypothetical protein [Gordonia sp. GONU]MCR8899719.1 hypothetical protein [Gordonia sp. GONU]